jgi:phosphatidylserine/phosphatidylglycerophosphate/cardiolipin synthase-like enzyme
MNRARLALFSLVAFLACADPCRIEAAGGSYQARTVLLANSAYGDALIEGIREARTTIIGTFYLFKISDSRNNQPRKIAEELGRAARRGVAVKVVLERDSGSGDRLVEENRATAAFLSREGVKVCFDSPAIVTHAKAAVIDGRYVYLGSHNLTQSALRHNNELSVRIDSPELAAEVTAYLARL